MGDQRQLGLGPKIVYLTRGETAGGVTIEVHDAPGALMRPADEAARLLDALLDLHIDTRRAFYTLLTQEMFDAFCAAPKKDPKKHEWPPKPRRPL